MSVSIALFTGDLRLHDNPSLRGALGSADQVVPLFVVDHAIRDAGFPSPNRAAFLAGCLADLDTRLRRTGARLALRTGDVTEQVRAVAAEAGAEQVHLAAGVSGYAQRREERLRRALELDGRLLVVHEAVVTAVAPGAVTPQGKDHYAVFTPYFRRWAEQGVREPLPAPRRIPGARVRYGSLPSPSSLAGGTPSPTLPEGGETAARRRLGRWLDGPLEGYADGHDDLPGDLTSRLSPYLHFGCLSAAELVHRATARGGAGADAFVRQLAWRDFHHQVLAARPAAAHRDYRSRGDHWRADADEIEAWRAGRTGYPIVDAAMRQLRQEGWMHNRARLLAASFLTKTLYADWRTGARHFQELLVDADMANNQLNWQWAAGTGTDTRPNRVLNPLTQAQRFDPDGSYVRRYVPELAGIPGGAVHRPWRLPAAERAALEYPEPIVDLDVAAARFRRARGLDD
ncbi:deoxyribodipyrimidine photo-lyase [Streptomyces sp. So13.3]|uniref:cryptochrome/photolyase family protein n=1 Tax=Streptomyces TaxID=1883 RepID=UPI00110678EB|nr:MULTISPECIES: deoxyribodipyrimidine photo-lyase [Streptomyces]QNA72173.1 deoxyribodipyrimidine photo-lyase [Streptomyces sp. So13.3]